MANPLVRLFGRSPAPLSGPVHDAAPQRLEPKRLYSPSEKKSVSLLPQGAYGQNYVFFSPDGGRTLIDISTSQGHMTLAFVAYWWVATRWRAGKIAEAPLMVVQEDPDTGDDEWLPDHPLAETLEMPSVDYDMGELVDVTSHYLDNTGEALWTIDRTRAGDIFRITPFSRYEFSPERGPGLDGVERLYANFSVDTGSGRQDWAAEDVCYFRDSHDGLRWGRGRSRLDVALSWLQLGAKAQQTIHSLLKNSMWPSAVSIPDKEWDPDPDTYKQYKQDLAEYAMPQNQGRPFVALGGGSFQILQRTIKDIVPVEILNRVESVVSAVSGVPAIVLQFQVGMENSPWSQMAQARRMAYDDTVIPAWSKLEKVMTRQILRPMDDDKSHYIRFDRSDVTSLQRDQVADAKIVLAMGNDASLNERRAQLGLEPLNDPKADEVPALTQPTMADILAATAAGGQNPSTAASGTNPDGTPKEPPPDKTPGKLSAILASIKNIQRKIQSAHLMQSFRHEAMQAWELVVAHQLRVDGDKIAQIVKDYITPAVQKNLESKARGKDRAMAAVSRYLNEESKSAWTKLITPLEAKAVQRSGAVIAADLDVSYSVIHPHLLRFASRETANLVTGVTSTTKDLVSGIIQGGLDASESTDVIARTISEATGFSKARATLIARTETTRAYNGAPQEALASFGKASGRTFTKTWSGVLDDRERDEHVEMEGETVPIGDAFSNGLDYPSEPNCRCTAIFNEED